VGFHLNQPEIPYSSGNFSSFPPAVKIAGSSLGCLLTSFYTISLVVRGMMTLGAGCFYKNSFNC